MRAETIQTNFASGIYSPLLKERNDLEGFYQALQSGKRITVFAHGGLASDGGFEYCGPTKTNDSKSVELIDWRFANDAEQCYALEFGDRYLRFFWGFNRRPIRVTTPSLPTFSGTGLDDLSIDGTYLQSNAKILTVEITETGAADTITITTDDITAGTMEGPITGAAQAIIIDNDTGLTMTFAAINGHTIGDKWIFYVGQPYEIATPYVSSEVRDIRTTQRGDVMYLYHENHPIRKLIRYAHDNWELQVVSMKSARWLGRESAVRWRFYDTSMNTMTSPTSPTQLDYKFSEESGSVLLGEGGHSGSIGWSSHVGWYDPVPTYLSDLLPTLTNFAIIYEGSIYIESEGEYTFAINVGMGGDFYLDGVLRIPWVNSAHSIFNPNEDAQTNYSAHKTAVTLTTGEHTFTIRCFTTNHTLYYGVALAWKKPGDVTFILFCKSCYANN
jgi:hypothetical protein